MSKKTVIGLNADYRTPSPEKPACSYVAAGYADCITAAGGIPLIIPPMEEVEDVRYARWIHDGRLLSGC